MIRNRRYVERSDVAVRAEPEVLLVKACQIFVDLASEDALVAESLQRLMKASQPCKQIDEPISPQLCIPSLSSVERQLKLLAPMLVKELMQSVADNILTRKRRTVRLCDATQLRVFARCERHAKTLHLWFVWHSGTSMILPFELR